MEKRNFAFDKVNFILMAISMLIVVLGFILMSGPGSTETHYNADIFSTMRIKVAPVVCFVGFISMIYAVIRKPKDEVLEKFTYASAPVGTGNQHWAEITKSALKLGVENFVVEDDIGLLDPFESAQISFTNLTKLIEEAKKEI